jgi:hypothetical protein
MMLQCLAFVLLSLIFLSALGCNVGVNDGDLNPLPRSLRDVPAERLAYRFTPDVEAPFGTENGRAASEKLEAIRRDFETRRTDDALLRTVLSPDGQRALALYATSETPEGAFRIDLYAADGRFLRNILPLDLIGAFPQSVAWSPDGQTIAFIGRRNPSFQETTPAATPEASPTLPVPSGTVAPLIPSVPTFNTEQVYVCDRDGFALRPLTTREGLIYFYLAWAPDGHALVALACKPYEFDLRLSEGKPTAGRPRLVMLDGQERLLDDRLTEVLPVWSPDSSKVAAAFDTEVMIYDAASGHPTQASIPLHEDLLAASARYDLERLKPESNGNTVNSGSETNGVPLSFNPIIRLEWPQPERLYLQTGFLRVYENETVTNYLRWHALDLRPQVASRK